MTSLARLRAWPRVAVLFMISFVLHAGTCQRAFDGGNAALQMQSPSGSAMDEEGTTSLPALGITSFDGYEQGSEPGTNVFDSLTLDPSLNCLLDEVLGADHKSSSLAGANSVPAPALASSSSQDTTPIPPPSPPLQCAKKLVVLPGDGVDFDTAVKRSILNIIEHEAQEFLEKGKTKVVTDPKIVEQLNQNGYKGITKDMVRKRRGKEGLGLPGGAATPNSRRSMYQSGKAQEILDLVQKLQKNLLQGATTVGRRPNSKRRRASGVGGPRDTQNITACPIPTVTAAPLPLVQAVANLSIDNKLNDHEERLKQVEQKLEEMSKRLEAAQCSVSQALSQGSTSRVQQALLGKIKADMGRGVQLQVEAKHKLARAKSYQRMGQSLEALNDYNDAIKACKRAESCLKGTLKHAKKLHDTSLKDRIADNITEVQTIASEAQKCLHQLHAYASQLWRRSQQAQQEALTQ